MRAGWGWPSRCCAPHSCPPRECRRVASRGDRRKAWRRGGQGDARSPCPQGHCRRQSIGQPHLCGFAGCFSAVIKYEPVVWGLREQRRGPERGSTLPPVLLRSRPLLDRHLGMGPADAQPPVQTGSHKDGAMSRVLGFGGTASLTVLHQTCIHLVKGLIGKQK